VKTVSSKGRVQPMLRQRNNAAIGVVRGHIPFLAYLVILRFEKRLP